MAASPPESGSIIYVKQFHHDQWLRVDVVSSVSVDYGASARIYRGVARLPHHSLDVALKVIPHVMSEVKEELLRRELKAISQLSEQAMRRILPFIGTASVQFHTVIVSEYMENGNLLQYFQRNPFADRQHLVIQVAEAVHWLHTSKNLVHGDLKCENVLVNNGGDALLADFGLATLVEKDASSITTVTAIRQMNTLRFAAPEILFGPDDEDNPIDNAARPRSKTCQSDVYAIGMLILQAFTGKRPWDSLSDNKLLGQLSIHAVHPRPPDHITMLGLTNSWWAVCLRCWVPEPQARPTMVWVWRVLEDTRRKPRALISGIRGLMCIALIPRWKRIVSGSHYGMVAVWDMETGAAIGHPQGGHTQEVLYVAVSPDGRRICSCGEDCIVIRWDAESAAPIGKPMTGHHGPVRSGAFSPDGTRIVSASDDKTVRLWNAATGEALGYPLAGHTDWVWFVAFSPDGARIASGSHDGTVRLWDSVTCETLGILPHYGSKLFTLCFSRDRGQLVSGDHEGRIRIWNASTGVLEHDINAHSAWIESVAASPSGRYIASGSHDRTVRIWDAHTGDAVAVPLTGHMGLVRTVEFTPDGRRLVTAAEDGTVRIWDLLE